MFNILREAEAGVARADRVDLLLNAAGSIMGNTICPFGDGAAMPILAFARKFREEFLEHGQTLHGGNLYDQQIHVPFIMRFPDRAAAEKHIADEPYVTGGIQKRWQIHRWRNSVPYTWRDCPRKEGNIQALFYGLDGPDGMRKRRENQEAHQAYLKAHGDSIMVRGPLLDDKGADPIGSVWLLDVPDLDAGRALLEGDPLYRSGVHKDKMFRRWRFGRVFDRFKV